MTNSVEKSVASEMTHSILDVCKDVFKQHGLVCGKTSSKYGDLYQFKTEAFSNDSVSRDVATQITTAIEARIKPILGGKLQITGISTKYGEGYSLTIKADAIALGRNGVNTASQWAHNFRMTAWQYELTDDALGTEALINGKTMFLAGVDIKRNGTVRIAVQDAVGQIMFINNESAITRFGGKVAQTIKVGR